MRDMHRGGAAQGFRQSFGVNEEILFKCTVYRVTG